MLLTYARFLGFQYFCAGCGGEEVRRIAAFPPHPLRTRFSQRIKAFWGSTHCYFQPFFRRRNTFPKTGNTPGSDAERAAYLAALRQNGVFFDGS